MRVGVDISDSSAPLKFAAALTAAPADEPVRVSLGDVDMCPNRIVPIVGMADAAVRRGRRIEFETLPRGVAARAVAGFRRDGLSPTDAGSSPFGRVWSFDNSTELNRLVDAFVLELDRCANLAKGVKHGFEWCVNEVMDNVITHSRPSGDAFGYVMVQFVAAENRLKVCVFDTGIGLRASFAGSSYAPTDACEAITLALQRNVTSGKGQGNGLWGLHALVRRGVSGWLHVRSDGAEYLFDPVRRIDSVRPCEPYAGFAGTTAVDFQMVCTEPTSLEAVFGEQMAGVDLWAESHEDAEGNLRLDVAQLAESLGTRDSAARVRHLAENAIDNDGRRVVLDFAGVESCSSAFADELVGRLLLRYGFAVFLDRVAVRNLKGFAAMLVNSTLTQRIASRGRCAESDQATEGAR